MAENNEWCEHLKPYGNELYSWQAQKHHIVTWAEGWKFCPICGTQKPKPSYEVELDDIMKKHLNQYNPGGKRMDTWEYLFTPNSHYGNGYLYFKKDILKWKRGEQ